jgi:hypothetical protein
MPNLKAVYFVSHSGMKWGKGLTLKAAMEGCYLRELKTKMRKDDVRSVISVALFKPETTDAELENLRNCIVADDMWGNPRFYENDEHPEYKKDREMIKRLFIGWISDESFCPAEKEKA